MRGSRTEPAIEERIFAVFCRSLSYATAGRETGVPRRTCIDIVRRCAGDGLAELRAKMRADLAAEAWDTCRELVGLITAETLGSAHSSLGSEAAAAALHLAKVAALLERADKVAPGDVPAPVINVFTGLHAPPEIEAEESGPADTGPIQDLPQPCPNMAVLQRPGRPDHAP